MTTNEIVKKYGKPNETGEGYLTTILLPYPMKLAWDLDTKVSKMRCHKLAAEPFINVFNDLLAHYGLKVISYWLMFMCVFVFIFLTESASNRIPFLFLNL